MVQGRHKSGTFRKTKVKTPGRTLKTRYSLKKPKKLTCSKCGVELKGMLRLRQGQQSKVSRTAKRPERAYSNLCAKCAKKEIVKKALKSELNA